MSPGRVAAVFVLVQVVLAAVYLGVEARRTPTGLVMRTVDMPAPPLAVAREADPVPTPKGDHLVHFWATWCGPCRAELPVLLAAADAHGVPLLAITDEPWTAVEAWFDGDVPAAVARDPVGDAADRWGVRELPDTFVVHDGRIVGHLDGPRAWDAPAAAALLEQLAGPR